MTKEKYDTAKAHYFKKASKFIAPSIWIGAVLLVQLVVNWMMGVEFSNGFTTFFLFCSLFFFCITIWSYFNLKSLRDDPLEDAQTTFSNGKTVEENFLSNTRRYKKRTQEVISYFSIAAFLILISLLTILASIADDRRDNMLADDGRIEVSVLQINDVYEINPLDSGRIGGMARVATLKKLLLQQNNNTILVMAGDFISPSVFNSVKQSDKRIFGKQMIEAMNLAGVDLTIFGNHEFDGDFSTLQNRINESQFQWIASNVKHKVSSGFVPFIKNSVDIPKYWIKTFTDGDGTTCKIGFLGLTLDDNKGGDPEYAAYDSVVKAAKTMYNELAKSCDAVIAVTHQAIKEDEMLAMEIPQLTAIIGGHEHDFRFEKVGNVYITKAHANAKSAFHLRILVDKNNDPKITVIPNLVSIDTTINPDYFVKTVCDKWMETAMNYFRDSGFSPEKIINENYKENLDGKESSTRFKPTNLTNLISNSMLYATKDSGTQISIFNAGSIRLDDMINSPITEYSILRALPYGGAVRIAKMKGFFIKKLINASSLLAGDGAFLQFSDNVNRLSATIAGTAIQDSLSYGVSIADYLIEGREKKMNFIQKGEPGLEKVYNSPMAKDSVQYDIRKAVIKYIEYKYKK